MADRREQILARLEAIFGTISGVAKTGRNVEDVTGKSRPAIIMHDASESSTDLSERPPGQNGRVVPKDYMILSPQIAILLGDRAEVVGTRVSAMRSALVKAIWTDSQLASFLGNKGDIRYTGCGLETQPGETREARLLVNFEFTYFLDCAEL